MRILDDDAEADAWALLVAPPGHLVAGASVLHLLAHRGGRWTHKEWYGRVAGALVDKVASCGAHCCAL
jgi:hypothetical protein